MLTDLWIEDLMTINTDELIRNANSGEKSAMDVLEPRVRTSRPVRVLFVCTGNINRSAAAEVLARQFTGWVCLSAGLNGKAGHLMSPKMRGLLGVEGFRSTAFTPELAAWADHLVGFQPSHIAALSSYGKPVHLIGIKDPHFDPSGVRHQECIQILREALPLLHREVVG